MTFERIEAPSLRELFVQQIENMILSGKLQVGEKLPPERELAENMQVSRAIVNAGLNELAAKGFVDLQPRVGAFVADFRKTGTAETLLSIMKYNGGSLRGKEVRSIIEIKLVLDKLAVRLALKNVTQANTNLLQTWLDELKSAEESMQAAKAAFGFYHQLAMISGNTLLPLMYNSFKVVITSLWAKYNEGKGANTLYKSAQKLYTAIAGKDETAALAALEETLTTALHDSDKIYN